jgi:regulator of cell morphogenesis and NO signaling
MSRYITRQATALIVQILVHFHAVHRRQLPERIRLATRAFLVHPIGVMRTEHDEHAERLAQLMRLTRDATPPEDACATWRQLCAAVRQFANDLQQLIDLANDVLFPLFEVPRGKKKDV